MNLSSPASAERSSRDPWSGITHYWYWMPLLVLALGLTSFALLVATGWIAERLLVRDIARLSAVSRIETNLAIAHLWLEEYVSGDEVPVHEIEDRLEDSRQQVMRMLHKPTGLATTPPLLPGPVDIQVLEEPGLRNQVKRLQAQLGQFDEMSRRRQNGVDQGVPEAVGIGSEIDQRYDAVFAEMLGEIQGMEVLLSDRVERNRARSRFLQRLILVAWVLIVALAVWGLWHRVEAERALSESEAQLRQAQKMEAVGRLAGGIAHDVNNYVAAITSQCELVRYKEQPGSYNWKKMNTVIETAFKVSALIKRLLAFSRKLPVQPEVVDLNQVIESLRRMVQRLIGEDVRLEMDLSPELWHVKMDPTQIEQVLVNLIVNARDAMPTGGVVKVITRNHRATKKDAAVQPNLWFEEYVRLAVTDDGEGIPEAEQGKIFEPFYTTKRNTGSSGIGLSTVYAIVQQASGLIRVESAVGQGTTFQIDLPRTLEEGPVAPTAWVAGERPGGVEALLLVEDNDDLRGATRSVLEALGYRVVACPNGETALEHFREHGDEFDMMVTDVVMPGMSGSELHDRIREQRPGLPVLFVSGYTDNVMLRHGIEQHEVNFLAKPYSAGQLARKVREVLEEGKYNAHIAI